MFNLKHTITVTVLASIMLLAAACVEDKTTKVPGTLFIDNADATGMVKLDFFNKAESKTFTFKADGEWFIRVPEEDKDWISVSPMAGSASSSEVVTVNVTVKPNTATEDRSSTLAFVCNKIEQKALLEVNQVKSFTIKATGDKTLANKGGDKLTFTVASNGTWAYELDDEGKTWLTEESKEDNTLVLTCDVLTVVKNSASIRFYVAEDPTIEQIIEVSQCDLNVNINASGVFFCKEGATATVGVTRINVKEWNIESSVPWLTATRINADQFTLTATANATKATRSGIVTITSPEEPIINTTMRVEQIAGADIIDVEFNEDHTATDVAGGHPVFYMPGENTDMKFSTDYNRWYPTFTKGMGSTISPASDSYIIDFDADMIAKMKDGYSMECTCMMDMTHNLKETKAFSSTKSGGTAIMVGASNVDYELIFLVNVPNTGSTASTWRMVKSGIKPEVGRFYHVIGVWDKAAGEGRVYVDGELKGTLEFNGEIKFGTLATNYWTIGANQNTADHASVNGSWHGAVVTARLYDAALSTDQVTLLSGTPYIIKPVEE